MKDMKNNSYSNDWLLLSSYLDDQLDPQAKRRLEERLRESPTLREDLESLRRTRNVLRAAPQRRVPRSFALTPEMVHKPKPSIWLAPLLSISSAVTAIIAFIVITMQTSPMGVMNTASDAVALQKEAAEVAVMETITVEEEPEIIYWNSQAGSDMGLYKEFQGASEQPLYTGSGEGYGEEGYTVIIPQATATPSGEIMAEENAAEEQAVEDEMMMESAPSVGEESPTGPQATQPAAKEIGTSEAVAVESEADGSYSDSPILGIQPTSEERSLSQTSPTQEVTRDKMDSAYRIKLFASGLLGLIAVCLAVASWYFWRKSLK